MAYSLEAVLTLKDKMSGPLRKATQGISETTRSASRAEGALAKMGSAAKGTAMTVAKVGTAAASATAALASGLGAIGISYNSKLEQAQIAWETLLGSQKEANKMMNDLQQFAAYTPFEFTEVEKSAKLMKAMGFEADNILPMMTAVGDAVSAVGGSADDLNGITRAIGQMNTKGKVSAEEMNQLAERGIGGWQILSEQMGKSKRELMEMAAQGKLMADDAIPALVKGMNQKFGGAMEKQSKTFSGMMSTLKDNVNMLLGDMSAPMFEKLKSLLPVAIDFVQRIKDAFSNGGWKGIMEEFLPQSLVDRIQGFADLGRNVFNKYSESVKSNLVKLKPVFDMLKSVVFAMGEAFKIVGPIIFDIIKKVVPVAINLISKLASGIGFLINNVVRPLFPVFGTVLKDVWEDIKPIFDMINSAINAVGGTIGKVANKIKGWFGGGTEVKVNGSHSGGLNRVPYSGYTARLHKGEMVLPRQAADEYRNGRGGNNVNVTGNTFIIRQESDIDAIANALAEKMSLAGGSMT